jgi:predicted site-specific integrase-resolvase
LLGDDGELLDVEAAAAILKVKPSTLRYWAREGKVKCIRLGPRATRWTRPVLRDIVAAKTDPGRQDAKVHAIA